SSNEPHQDRHLVTASQSCKSAHRARRLSTGHGRARSHIKLSSQIARPLAAFDATSGSFNTRFTIGELAGPARPQSTNSLAAPKSPYPRRTTHVPLCAVSFLGGFRTPAAEYAALSLKRPASETLHNKRHGASFENLVGGAQQCRWKFEPE